MAVQRQIAVADRPGQPAGDIHGHSRQRVGHEGAGRGGGRQGLGPGAIDMPSPGRAPQPQRNCRQMRPREARLDDRRGGRCRRSDDHFMGVTGDDGADAFDRGDDAGGIFRAWHRAIAIPAMAERDDDIGPPRAQRRHRAAGGNDHVLGLQILGQPDLPFDGLRGQDAEDADGQVMALSGVVLHPPVEQQGFGPQMRAVDQAGIGKRHRIAGIAQRPAQEIDAMGEIVIAKGDGIELQPVQGGDRRVKIMGAQTRARKFVRQRRALDQVAIVEQQDIAVARAFLCDQRRQPGEAAGRIFGAQMHMQVGRGQDTEVQRGQLG